MDVALLRLARAYRRRDGPLDEDEARDELLYLYELYTGEEIPNVPELKSGLVDNGLAGGAALVARGVANAFGLDALKRPAGMLARQGVKRSREDVKLMRWVREDRRALRFLLRK